MNVHGKLEDLARELKAARHSMKLSLSAVAKPAKISAAYVQKLEAGTVKNPSPRVLHRLAGVLGLSYAGLMELAGYFMPDADGARGRARAAPQADDLTTEERKAVAAFIAYLKEQRGKD